MKKIGIIAMLSLFGAFAIQASHTADIKVDTFDTTPLTLSQCEDVPGSGVATFDLADAESQIVDILPNMQINWYVDAGLSMSIANPMVHVTSSSTVFAQVISTLDTICKTTEEVTLVVLSAPNLSYLATIPDTFCGRPIVQLGDNSAPMATYLWTPSTFLDSDTIANPIFTPDPDIDEYMYIVSATSLNGSCSTTDTVRFTVLTAEFEIDALDTVELCKGNALIPIGIITSENPENVMWSSSRDTISNMSGPTTSINAEYSTFIYAQQRFANGCLMFDTVFLRVDSLPEFDISVIPDPMEPCQKYCPGSIVTLVTNAPDLPCYPDIEHQWMPTSMEGGDIVGADTNLNVALALSNANTRDYIRTTTNHACVEVDTHLVEVVDTIIDINGLPMGRICRGYQFQIMIDSSDLVNLTEINWVNDFEDQLTLSCEDCPNPIVKIADNAMSGSVSVSVMGIAELCCPASGILRFNIAVPEIPIPEIDVCVGGSGEIPGLATFTNYEWTNVVGGILSADNIRNPIISNVQNGGASMTVNAIASDGCPSEDQYFVRSFFADGPVLIASPTCDGGNSPITNSSTGYTDYVWTLIAGQGEPNNANSSAPIITNVGPNGATFNVTATDADGCLTSQEIDIIVTEVLELEITATRACLGGSSEIAILDGGLSNIIWDNPSSGSLSDNTSATPVVTGIMATDTMFLKVTANDQNGCKREGEAVIIVDPAIRLQLAPSMPCPEAPVTVELPTGYNFENNQFSTNNDTIIVDFNVSNNMLVISNTPEFDFWVFFTTNSTPENCIVQDSFYVDFRDPSACDFDVPNAFAPSDRERLENTTFQPLDGKMGNPLPESRIDDFVIYNRWGQKVYDNDSNATGWDGRQDGELAPSDVYLYIIKYRDVDGAEQVATGDVTLIR